MTKCLGCLGVVRYLDSIMYYTKQRIIFEGISWLFNDTFSWSICVSTVLFLFLCRRETNILTSACSDLFLAMAGPFQ